MPFESRHLTLTLVTFACLLCAAFGCGSKSGASKPRFIGCYHDNKGQRDLAQDETGEEGSRMTVTTCEALCRRTGHQYFGLQGGEECHCGDSYGKFGPAEAATCDRVCNANPNEICGGVMANSVYEISYQR